MSLCEDCGCKTDNGMCPNCHEELWILEHQFEDIDFPISDEFAKKAEEQKEEIRKRKTPE